mgnify:CR=1 FL=1
MIFGWPGQSLDFSNLTAHGGFFPNGVVAIFSAIVVVIFSVLPSNNDVKPGGSDDRLWTAERLPCTAS